MAADAWQLHDGWLNSLHKGDADTDTDVFSIRLYRDPSEISDKTVNSVASVTNEHPQENNYFTGGLVRAVTVTETSGSVRFDIEDFAVTASGGDIQARYAGIIDDTAGLVVAHSLLDNSPADVKASDGNVFTVEISASGVYQTVQV